MDLLDDPVLVYIISYVCRCTEYNICWIETCKLQLVCKKWNEIIKYLRNRNDIRKKICKGILEWHSMYEIEAYDIQGFDCNDYIRNYKNYKNNNMRIQVTISKKDSFQKIYFGSDNDVYDYLSGYDDSWIGNKKLTIYNRILYGLTCQKIYKCVHPENINMYNVYSSYDNNINNRDSYIFMHIHDTNIGICTYNRISFKPIFSFLRMFNFDDNEVTKSWEPFYTG